MKRHATAFWHGALADGTGILDTESGSLKNAGYSFASRFEPDRGETADTNPEELLAAAHAGCFAMQLSHMLAEDGTPAEELNARCDVEIVKDGDGFTIKSSALKLTGKVPGISNGDFEKIANKAKETCPMSKALGAIDISLEAELAD